jgi:hypothetical protein
VRKNAKVKGRWHDNRHTLITELAESGAGAETVMEIAGHVDRQMLRHNSHIRMKAKQAALEAVVARRKDPSKPGRQSIAIKISRDNLTENRLLTRVPARLFTEIAKNRGAHNGITPKRNTGFRKDSGKSRLPSAVGASRGGPALRQGWPSRAVPSGGHH